MIDQAANILAEDGGIAQVLIVMAVVGFVVVGAIMEKLKNMQKPTDGLPRPPIIPPVNPAPNRPAPRAPVPERRPVMRPTPAVPPRPRVPATVPPPVRPPRISAPAQQTMPTLESETRRVVTDSVAVVPSAKQMAKPRAGQHNAAAVDFQIPTTAELRRAIILNEILGPPVALRDPTAQA